MTSSGRVKHAEVEALQDKVRLRRALKRHQEGVVDIAGPYSRRSRTRPRRVNCLATPIRSSKVVPLP